MKRLIALVMAFCMLLTAGAFAADFELSIFVNGEKLYFPDAAPFIDANSRTLVPVRFVSEALNANVEWNGDLRQVTVTKGEKVIVLTIDSKEMIVNGDTKTQDSAPIISESRTFVPLRFVSEELDANVVWNGEVRAVYITTNGESQVNSEALPEKITGNGFEIDVAEGDRVTEKERYTLVVKGSGMGVQYYKDQEELLKCTYMKKSANNPEQAKQELIEIVSQVLSDEMVNSIDAYFTSNVEIGVFSDSLTLKTDDLYVSVNSSKSSIQLNVRKNG